MKSNLVFLKVEIFKTCLLFKTYYSKIVALIVGDVTCLATIPPDMEVEAHFLAKENGIVAGIALAEMVFYEVDPTLKVQKHCILCA